MAKTASDYWKPCDSAGTRIGFTANHAYPIPTSREEFAANINWQSMSVPNPTRILRFLHIDNLSVVMQWGGLHAPNSMPADGLIYRAIHNLEVQKKRSNRQIPCGPGGVIHDYVPFYFGPLSPMMLNLKTGRVPGYTEGQEPLIYLETTVQAIAESEAGFVFSDGHGIAAYTSWFDNLAHLDRVDWNMVYQRYWTDNANDMDRQRKKQAEFLVHQFCDWSLVQAVIVIDEDRKAQVEKIFSRYPPKMHRQVIVKRDWYFH